MKNLKKLIDENGNCYYWNFEKAKYVLNKCRNERKGTKAKMYDEISKLVCISQEGVKNWFTNKNGPNDFEQVSITANYLGVEISSLVDGRELEFMDVFDGMNFDMNYSDTVVAFKNARFISMLNLLAEKTTNGYIGFSKAKYDEFDTMIIYDDAEDSIGEIVMDKCVDEEHHDIVDTYDYYVEGINYEVRYMQNEEGEEYLEVTNDYNDCIVIENGYWYFG